MSYQPARLPKESRTGEAQNLAQQPRTWAAWDIPVALAPISQLVPQGCPCRCAHAQAEGMLLSAAGSVGHGQRQALSPHPLFWGSWDMAHLIVKASVSFLPVAGLCCVQFVGGVTSKCRTDKCRWLLRFGMFPNKNNRVSKDTCTSSSLPRLCMAGTQ